jgi:hypothetical protein
MDVTPQQQWAGNLADTIEKRTRIRPARHVLARMTSLLYPAEPQFVDAYLVAEQFLVNGHIVVFTEDLVAVATVSKMRPMEDFRELSHEETVVSVRVVPRSTLKAVDLPPVHGPMATNNSPTWQLRSGDLTEWPYGASVSLVYPELPQPLLVPSGVETAGFQEFLAKLMSDLAH